jgi:hypothetical protein
MSGLRAVAVVAAVAAAAALAQGARADGDPASDVLVVDTIFVPFASQLPHPLRTKLELATREALKKGYPIRVALIEQPVDLGAVPSLYGKPQTYAQFLWQELSFVYKGRLLVVMPNGFGYYDRKPPDASQARVLAKIPIGAGLDGMASSALNAVLALAAAGGVKLSVAPVAVAASQSSSGSSSTDDRLIIGGAVGGAVLLGAAAMLVRRRVRA